MPELAPDDYQALVDAMVETVVQSRPRIPATAPRSPERPSALETALESTRLAADVQPADVDALCDEAERLGLAAVCVNPCWVARAVARLRATPVLVVTVVGFPLGASAASSKLREAEDCLRLGADELDVVMNLGALKAGWDEVVRAELAAIVGRARDAGAGVKAICETALLSRDEKLRACGLALDAGADFIKTSSGFAGGGATVEDVALFREAIAAASAANPGARMAIKAAGGIRTRAQAEALLRAGASRIGTSAAAAILAGSP